MCCRSHTWCLSSCSVVAPALHTAAKLALPRHPGIAVATVTVFLDAARKQGTYMPFATIMARRIAGLDAGASIAISDTYFADGPILGDVSSSDDAD